MPETLCERCRERAATVFITRFVDNQTTKQRLCVACAQHAAGAKEDGSMLDATPFAPTPVVPGALLEELVRNLLKQMPGAELSGVVPSLQQGEFSADEDALDDLEDLEAMLDTIANTQSGDGTNGGGASNGNNADEEEEPDEVESHDAAAFSETAFSDAPSHPLAPSNSLPFDDSGIQRASDNFGAERCPKCGTTWDRLRQDGRAGCSHCYLAFATQLAQVMERVQRASQHAGKAPRAAEKRQRRLLHLRARRDHRLEMLNRRLKESVARENYEEAAKLRDKIKILTSTIVEP